VVMTRWCVQFLLLLHLLHFYMQQFRTTLHYKCDLHAFKDTMTVRHEMIWHDTVGEDRAEEMQGRTMTTPNLQALLFLHRTSLNFRIPQVYPFVTINLGLESLLTLVSVDFLYPVEN
jgi:hypothetical protein